MGSIKISQLAENTSPAGTEELVINDGGISKKIKISNLPDNDTTYSVGDGGLTEINFTSAKDTKLTGIETGATADQTGAEIKAAYELEADTNAFTDADHTKLDGIETSATADQTGAEIKTAYEAELNTNAYTDAEKTKLAGVDDSANNYTHPTGAGNEHLPFTVSQTEAGYLDGVTSAIQTQLDAKLASGGTLATATITTLNSTTVDLGNWTITESVGVLYFATSGINKAKLDASGNFTVAGDITAYGTI